MHDLRKVVFKHMRAVVDEGSFHLYRPPRGRGGRRDIYWAVKALSMECPPP